MAAAANMAAVHGVRSVVALRLRASSSQRSTGRHKAVGVRTRVALGVRHDVMFTRRCRDVATMSSAAGAMDGEPAADPYKVLGLEEGADADKVQRAYDRRKMLYKGEDDKLAACAAAYDSILQMSMQARLKGGGVSDNLKFADKLPMFLWQPRLCISPIGDIRINLGIALFATLATIMSPPEMRTMQPTIFGAMLQVFRMFLKLTEVDPGPSASIDAEKAKKHNQKRFVRSFMLGFGTFVVSAFAIYWFPNMLIQFFRIKMPLWFLLHQEIVVSFFVSMACALMVSRYR